MEGGVQFFRPPVLRSSSRRLPGAAENRHSHLACENQSSPCGLSRSHTPTHLLQVLAHCVPRHYLFLEDVFLLFLQLFLITSFGHSIPKKLWQRQRCKEGKDKTLVRTISHTIFTEGELIPGERHVYYCTMTKEQRMHGWTDEVGAPTLPLNCRLGDLRETP